MVQGSSLSILLREGGGGGLYSVFVLVIIIRG